VKVGEKIKAKTVILIYYFVLGISCRLLMYQSWCWPALFYIMTSLAQNIYTLLEMIVTMPLG